MLRCGPSKETFAALARNVRCLTPELRDGAATEGLMFEVNFDLVRRRIEKLTGLFGLLQMLLPEPTHFAILRKGFLVLSALKRRRTINDR